jgi:hypothetical protein
MCGAASGTLVLIRETETSGQHMTSSTRTTPLTHKLELLEVDPAVLVLVRLVDELEQVRHDRRLDRSAVADRVHVAERRALDTQMGVRLDRASVDLVREQGRHARRERVHRDAGRPEDEVGGDVVFLDGPVRELLRVRDRILADLGDAGVGDEVDAITVELALYA